MCFRSGKLFFWGRGDCGQLGKGSDRSHKTAVMLEGYRLVHPDRTLRRANRFAKNTSSINKRAVIKILEHCPFPIRMRDHPQLNSNLSLLMFNPLVFCKKNCRFCTLSGIFLNQLLSNRCKPRIRPIIRKRPMTPKIPQCFQSTSKTATISSGTDG